MGTVISPEEWLRKPGSVGTRVPGSDDHHPRRRRQRAAAGRDRVGVRVGDDGDAEVRIPQRAGEDRRRVAGQRVHRARPRFARRGRLPVPRRPPGRPHPPRGRQHLPGRGRACAGDAPRCRRLPRCSVCPTNSSGSGCTPSSSSGPASRRIPTRSWVSSTAGSSCPYKFPATIEFIDALPREPNGKVLKRQLRRRPPRGDLIGSDMTETCHAAVFLGNDSYEVREFPVPDPPPGGAVLQVEAVGLCGSDVAQFHGVELVPGGACSRWCRATRRSGVSSSWHPTPSSASTEGDRVAVDEILSPRAVPHLRLLRHDRRRRGRSVGRLRRVHGDLRRHQSCTG